jgi:serine/threonine-protein kinase
LLGALLALELAYRVRAGERVERAEYRRRFPEQTAHIDALFAEMGPASPIANDSPVTPGGICLRVTAGPHLGGEFTFTGHDTFIIGRSPRAHFRLATRDRYFSRYHFLVEVNPPQCRLNDLGSRNGTHVNGRRVKTIDLKDGDVIKAGRTMLKVSIPRGAADSAESAVELCLVPSYPPVTTVPPDKPPSPVPSAGRKKRADPSGTCTVCLAPIAPGEVTQAVAGLSFPAPPLCRSCMEAMRQHPQPVPGFRIVREMGHGGMGVVYVAVREADGGVVAVKTIKPAIAGTPGTIERFLREARILKELDHPHIVAFYEMGECHNQLFFAMEYVRGVSARALLKTQGALAVPRAVHLVCQLLEALAFAHARGFVHRDIKPANVLITGPEKAYR